MNIKTPSRSKFFHWLKRYLPPEILGTVTAIIGSSLVYYSTNNSIFAAFAGTWGENVGFYGIVIVKDIRASLKEHKKRNFKYTFKSFFKNTRNIILEFGFSELADSFFIRPFWMYTMPKLLGNFELGIIVGKLLADITFYLPTILSYELRNKFLPDFKEEAS